MMTRVHLAQIHYNPAYFEPPVDHLEEPTFPEDLTASIGTLRSMDGNFSISPGETMT